MTIHRPKHTDSHPFSFIPKTSCSFILSHYEPCVKTSPRRLHCSCIQSQQFIPLLIQSLNTIRKIGFVPCNAVRFSCKYCIHTILIDRGEHFFHSIPLNCEVGGIFGSDTGNLHASFLCSIDQRLLLYLKCLCIRVLHPAINPNSSILLHMLLLLR